MSDTLKKIVEAVLLVADAPLSVGRIQTLFDADSAPSSDAIKKAIAELQTECEARGIELKKIGNAYRYQTREKYAEWIRKLHATRPPRLSRALLETLAIIAYRQPVTRGDIENIRGVSVTTEIMRRLQEREWIKEVGVRDVPGHPALFSTTPEFLAYFGLEALDSLPSLPEQRDLGAIAGELEEKVAAENAPDGMQNEHPDGADDGMPDENSDDGMPDETDDGMQNETQTETPAQTES